MTTWPAVLRVASAAMIFLMPPLVAAADTIDTIKKTGTITIGYRADSAPFSSQGADGKPTGYSVALCMDIAKAVAQTQGIKGLKIMFQTVTAADRFETLKAGKIDILCEGTSETIQRMETLDFTMQTFVSGASLMVRADQRITGIQDLAGRKIGVLKNTTTADGLRGTLKQGKIAADVVVFDDHDAGLAALEQKTIDAYFADRELLIGMKARSKAPEALLVAEEYLTNEPYALAIRQNDYRLKLIANLTLSRLYRSRAILDRFNNAFPDRKPSQLLKALYVLNGLPE
jgi:polar amino acid transport system substrate-binding protein